MDTDYIAERATKKVQPGEIIQEVVQFPDLIS